MTEVNILRIQLGQHMNVEYPADPIRLPGDNGVNIRLEKIDYCGTASSSNRALEDASDTCKTTTLASLFAYLILEVDYNTFYDTRIYNILATPNPDVI